MDAEDRWALQTLEWIEALRPIALFDEVMDALYEKAPEALELAFYSHWIHNKGWVPVLPMIPPDLMKVEASNFLGRNELQDIFPTPRVPYFLVDIDVGEILPKLDAQRALLAIRTTYRYPLTFQQAHLLLNLEKVACPGQVFALGTVDPEHPRRPIILYTRDEESLLDSMKEGLRLGAPSFGAII